MQSNKKLQVWVPLFLALSMAIGMFFGYKLHQEAGTKTFFSNGNSGILQEAMDLIKNNYVDTVGIDTLQNNIMNVVTNNLDPHSLFFPASELKEVNEDLAGRFEGIGIEFTILHDTVNITYVLPHGPGDVAGIVLGDKLIKINDSTILGKQTSFDKMHNLIRGPRNSTLSIQYLRNNKLFNTVVTRGLINVPSLDAAYMINATTGYIKLNKFVMHTYNEFVRALDSLIKIGMKSLALDLRGNSGGYMDEAVNIADEFLDNDKLIVYTQGAHSTRHEYKCKRKGLFETGKLVVIVDELTASASEVLAGALQDWDRATIVGRRSFGKGLVQEQFTLSNGAAMRLTVARYYTPLGRSIQRSYASGKKIYMDELWKRYADGEMVYADSNKIAKGKIYTTPNGKQLYGGGGIFPDVFVAMDTTISIPKITHLIGLNANNFVYNFYTQHENEIKNISNEKTFEEKYLRDDQLWNAFTNEAYLHDSLNMIKISPAEKQAIQNYLTASLARYKWRDMGYFRLINNFDVTWLAAIKEFEHK